MFETRSASVALEPRQITIVVGLGVAFWIGGVLTIRLAAAAGLFDGGTRTLALFAAAVPAGWLLVRVVRRLAALSAPQLVPGAALATAVAVLCDGVALTWAPGLYGAGEFTASAAAWLLWFVGVGILASFAMVAAGGSG